MQYAIVGEAIIALALLAALVWTLRSGLIERREGALERQRLLDRIQAPERAFTASMAPSEHLTAMVPDDAAQLGLVGTIITGEPTHED